MFVFGGHLEDLELLTDANPDAAAGASGSWFLKIQQRREWPAAPGAVAHWERGALRSFLPFMEWITHPFLYLTKRSLNCILLYKDQTRMVWCSIWSILSIHGFHKPTYSLTAPWRSCSLLAFWRANVVMWTVGVSEKSRKIKLKWKWMGGEVAASLEPQMMEQGL